MILKPSSCNGCPFEHNGKYFTPDTIVSNSKVLFVAQNPGDSEEQGHKLIKRHWQGSQYHDEYSVVTPQPLIGATGQLFNRRFLPLTGLQRSEISVANAIRCRPGLSLGLAADGLPTLTDKMKLESSNADIVKAVKHCKQAHLQIPSSTKLIVTMGAYALYQLTGIKDVMNWRGYGFDTDHFSLKNFNTYDTDTYNDLQTEINIFSTMHIAALFKGDNKKYYHATLQDFHKISRLLKKQWPIPLPEWSSNSPLQWPSYAAFDTEYYPDNNKLIRWSLCDTDYKLYCVEAEDTDYDRIPILPNSTVVIQNALADIAHLANIVDFSQVNVEDLMLAHSVLWTGEPHSLNYIASIAGAFNRYKHLSSDLPQLYSALDAYEPMYIWKNNIIPEFRADKASWNIYKKYRLPLINIINKAQQSGVKINSSRLNEVQRILQQRINAIKEEAIVITGDAKFNLGGSKRLKEEIYGNE